MKLDPSWRGQTWCKCIVRLIDSPWFAGLKDALVGLVSCKYTDIPLKVRRWEKLQVSFWSLINSSSLESDVFCFISGKNSWLVWCLQYGVKCPAVGFHSVVFFSFPKNVTKKWDQCAEWNDVTVCVCVCLFCFSSMDVYRLNSQTLILLIFLHLHPRGTARESGIKTAMCDIPSYQPYHFCLHSRHSLAFFAPENGSFGSWRIFTVLLGPE